MTPSEVQAALGTFKYLWPKVRWGDGDFDVFTEGALRIDIEPAQASAALRAMKGRTSKYPAVSDVLDALRKAENKPHVGAASPLPQQREPEPIWYDADGLTSFERRVQEEPAFAAFAAKNGRMPPERMAKLLGRAWTPDKPDRKTPQEAIAEIRRANA